ncbi:putative metallocarboxypeptidase ecm14 [Colletotrichum spaethianum]|uniref:Metallocarboxypeptidase ecm14 n=1 Tax=Colletotrichum spaethianum TaxID=700344 RepID=A0AA37PAW0_9PEZI|nr:putative metallocarboxypeptidase ecm14 [Colletotrichum spaethianum]GKT48837.1 putative metallocarboxypeptidase ecm14 [Colletotrichum spaethianum]
MRPQSVLTLAGLVLLAPVASAARFDVYSDRRHETPARLRDDHVNEVVLRFNLTTAEEETAFAAAAARTFLDVWTFNREYVDVRIHKGDIGSLLSLLPVSLKTSYSTLITDLAAAVYDTYPALDTPVQIHRVDGRRADLKPARSGSENYFFQDYQKLDVGDSWPVLSNS